MMSEAGSDRGKGKGSEWRQSYLEIGASRNATLVAVRWRREEID